MAVASGPAPGYGAENQPPDEPWRENLNIHVVCPDCKQFPPDLVEENADLICANCGVVLQGRLISYESEWRTFNSDEGKGEDPNRVGEVENELFTASNVGTTIGGGMNSTKEGKRLKRAQAAQQENKADKALTQAYMQIDQWGETANLPAKVRNTAKSYYKRVYDAATFRGKSLDATLAGCLFIACRQTNVPRSFSEMMGLTTVSKKEIGRTYKQLEKFLIKSSNDMIDTIQKEGGNYGAQFVEFTGTSSAKPEDLVARFCNMMGLPYRVEFIAKGLAQKIHSVNSLAGRSPLSNAAACIYFASHLIGMGRNTKAISEVAGVSDATIKHAYKYLLQEKARLVEDGWLGPQPGKDGGNGSLENLPSS